MNKMAEKVSAVMNENELMQLIADHYQGEAQLLTTGAEENLLKLAELRGNGLTDLVDEIRTLGTILDQKPEEDKNRQDIPWEALLDKLDILGQQNPTVEVEVVSPPQPGMQNLLEGIVNTLNDGFMPLINLMDKKLELDLKTHRNMATISKKLNQLGELMGQKRTSSSKTGAE